MGAACETGAGRLGLHIALSQKQGEWAVGLVSYKTCHRRQRFSSTSGMSPEDLEYNVFLIDTDELFKGKGTRRATVMEDIHRFRLSMAAIEFLATQKS